MSEGFSLETEIASGSDDPKQASAQTTSADSGLVRNVLSNWASLASGIVYSLAITPAVIRALDTEAYGVWSFLNAFVAYSSLLYLGLGAAFIRYGAHYYAVGNRAAIDRLTSVVTSIYSAMGLVAVGAAVILAPYVPELIRGGVPTRGATAASLTLVVLSVRAGLMFVASAFTGLLFAKGRIDLGNLVTVAGNIGRLAIVPLVLRSANPLLAMAFTFTLTGAIEVAALAFVAKRVDPQLKLRFVVPTFTELQNLYGYGVLVFLVQVSDRIISYTDTTVIGLVLGAKDVALYALPLQLSEYGRVLVFGLAYVLFPHLAGLKARGELDRIRHSYVRTVKLTGMVGALVNIALISLGPAFLRLWVGPVFSQPAAPILICLGIAGLVQAIAVTAQSPFYLALGKVRFVLSVLVAEAGLNLCLSIILARSIGIIGVAIATVVPAMFVSGLFVPLYVARQVGVPLRRLFRRSLWPTIVLTGVITLFQLVLHSLISLDSYVALLLSAVGTCIVGAVAYWLLASSTEQRMVIVSVARIRRVRFLSRRSKNAA